MSTTITFDANTQSRTRILLDPDGEPAELSAASLMREQREDSTIYVGFVVDDATSKPLEGVAVSSYPSGTQTTTDGRGFFKLAIPLQTPEQTQASPAQLSFEKKPYRSQHRIHLELSPRMVWKYSIRLSKGSDAELIDEANFRRMDVRKNDEAAASSTVSPAAASIAASATDPSPQATAATNSTVRVPRNIRVLQSNGTTVDYLSLDTYAKHVLPAEWIASWGNITGGSNSLNAGAVAVRCYAIVKLNGATSTSAYDICGTTSCQVYNPTTTSANTDTAVNFTANWVVINTNGTIATTEFEPKTTHWPIVAETPSPNQARPVRGVFMTRSAAVKRGGPWSRDVPMGYREVGDGPQDDWERYKCHHHQWLSAPRLDLDRAPLLSDQHPRQRFATDSGR